MTDELLVTAVERWRDATVEIADRVKDKFEQSKVYADVNGLLCRHELIVIQTWYAYRNVLC